MTQPQSDISHPPSEDRLCVLLTHNQKEEEYDSPALSNESNEDFQASINFDELARQSQGSSSQLTLGDSERSLLNDKSCSKVHRRRSLELSCVNLKIDLAERCTALDEIRQELTSTYSERSLLSEEVVSLKSQLSEMQSKMREQADIIRNLRKNAKESALERVKLRVQVESLQAECNRHKLQTRRFKNESARATAEAKEMHDVVHFMRAHTERLMLEKEESDRRLATFEDEVVGTETQEPLPTPKDKPNGIIHWFGGKIDKEDAENSKKRTRSMPVDISSLQDEEQEEAEDEENGAAPNETKSQELPDKADLNSRRRHTLNWFTSHLHVSDQESNEQKENKAMKRTRKGLFSSIIHRDAPDTAERKHYRDAVTKNEDETNVADMSAESKVETNAGDDDNNSSAGSETSVGTHSSLPELSSLKHVFQQQRVMLTLTHPQHSSFARPA